MCVCVILTRGVGFKYHFIVYSWAGLDSSKYIDQGALKLTEITLLFLTSHPKISYSLFLTGFSLFVSVNILICILTSTVQ